MKKIEFAYLSDMPIKDQILVLSAIESRKNAYVPITNYKVGAAIRASDKSIHIGSNIEIEGLTLTRHAEMMAMDNMINSGIYTFDAIAIASTQGDEIPRPCAMCCHYMAQFNGGEGEIFSIDLYEDETPEKIDAIYIFTLEELMPFYFSKREGK